jgi:arginine/lysine/ornithine decarboxylase
VVLKQHTGLTGKKERDNVKTPLTFGVVKMIKITVPSLPVRQLKGVSKAGKPYDMRIQTVYAHTVDSAGQPLPFPEKTKIVLDADQAPYPPGVYVLSPGSIAVNHQGRLEVYPKLLAAKTA